VIFDYLASRQSSDGSWQTGHIGHVFTTACHLTILQLDKGTLPISADRPVFAACL
jgi:hypothetical protein